MSRYINLLTAYISLTKPAIQFLLLVTALAAVVVEGSLVGNPGKIALLMILYYLAGGSAKAFNQIFEGGNDAIMLRTKYRPIPSNKIARKSALVFASVLSLISVISLWIWYGIMPALLTLLTILFYGFFYTLYLKPRTRRNIVFGGLTGSMAPIIGWISAGGKLSPVPLLMGAIVFFWSPPHFWTLTMYYRDD